MAYLRSLSIKVSLLVINNAHCPTTRGLIKQPRFVTHVRSILFAVATGERSTSRSSLSTVRRKSTHVVRTTNISDPPARFSAMLGIILTFITVRIYPCAVVSKVIAARLYNKQRETASSHTRCAFTCLIYDLPAILSRPGGTVKDRGTATKARDKYRGTPFLPFSSRWPLSGCRAQLDKTEINNTAPGYNRASAIHAIFKLILRFIRDFVEDEEHNVIFRQVILCADESFFSLYIFKKYRNI